MPADEALAMVVVERSGRPLVASNADLTGAGGLGTDLAARFLDRLSEEAGLTVHVRLIEGEDTGQRARGDLQGARRRARPSVRRRPLTEGDEMEKRVVRTEAAPAPFQGAPYNQAIVAGELVFTAGQLGLKPGDTAVEGDITQQTEQALANVASDPRGGRELDGEAREDERLPDRPRRLPGDERGLRDARRRQPAGALDVPGREAPVGRARRDRGDRPPVARPLPRGSDATRRESGRVPTAIRRYIRSLGLDAYVVGGAVRDELLGIEHADEDFLVPGVDQAALRSALEPHGRVEDMEVHGQLVGVRFYPRAAEIRALVPAGIELTPPRVERSVGPGHRDFEIVADPSVSIEDDMARRDFTVNAMARRLETGELVDPFGGLVDLERRELRTVSPQSFREDPLRILRGLRLVSQLSFSLPPGDRRPDARGVPRGCATSPASGSEAGSPPTGWASSRSCSSGRGPGTRFGSRATRARSSRSCRSSSAAIGYELASSRAAAAARRAPVRRRPEHRRRRRRRSRCGSPRCSTTSASPRRTRPAPTTLSSARGSRVACCAASATRTCFATRSSGSSRRTPSGWTGRSTRSSRGASSPPTGSSRRATWSRTSAPTWRRRRSSRGSSSISPSSSGSSKSERESPHRLADLAVNGDDLIAIGYREGPALGAELARLLDVVVDDPAANDRATLLELARRRARVNAAAVRERYLRLREEAGPGVTVVAATKYVSLDDLGVLAEAGVEVVGENRAQDLAAKHAVYGDAFRWHFIGHLQSNKVKVVNEICELVHSLDSESAARRLTVARAARGEPLRESRRSRVSRPRRSAPGSSGCRGSAA